MKLNNKKIVWCISGSFCTLDKIIEPIQRLKEQNVNIIPVVSENVANTNTRFGLAKDIMTKIEKICENSIIKTIVDSEPIGPILKPDLTIVSPCSGCTLAKLTYGIIDTSVTMAVKSTLRNSSPIVIHVSTNDGLSNSLKNIGYLLNTKNYYFVPFKQDDYIKKPNSLVADFNLIEKTISLALDKKQIQPILAV